MKVYIASSWKNQHAVEMLTHILRMKVPGVEVLSFVENNFGEGHGPVKPVPFEEWMQTPKSDNSFVYDTKGATKSDVVIYISPSGTDAWAEVGAAWASGVPVLGLWAKGEGTGLMRKMVRWFDDWAHLVGEVNRMSRGKKHDA